MTGRRGGWQWVGHGEHPNALNHEGGIPPRSCQRYVSAMTKIGDYDE